MIEYESDKRWLMPLMRDDERCESYEVLFSCRDARTGTPYVVCRPFPEGATWDGREPDPRVLVADGDVECIAVTIWGDDADSKNVICAPAPIDYEIRNEAIHAFRRAYGA